MLYFANEQARSSRLVRRTNLQILTREFAHVETEP